MAGLVVELESCTVVFPEGFDANQWLIDCYLEDRRYQESMAGQRTVTMPAPKQRRAHSILSQLAKRAESK